MRVNSATFRGLIAFTFEKLTRIIRQKKQEGLDVFSDSGDSVTVVNQKNALIK